MVGIAWHAGGLSLAAASSQCSTDAALRRPVSYTTYSMRRYQRCFSSKQQYGNQKMAVVAAVTGANNTGSEVLAVVAGQRLTMMPRAPFTQITGAITMIHTMIDRK